MKLEAELLMRPRLLLGFGCVVFASCQTTPSSRTETPSHFTPSTPAKETAPVAPVATGERSQAAGGAAGGTTDFDVDDFRDDDESQKRGKGVHGDEESDDELIDQLDRKK